MDADQERCKTADEQEVFEPEDDWVENAIEIEIQEALSRLTDLEEQELRIDHNIAPRDNYSMDEVAAHSAFWPEKVKKGDKSQDQKPGTNRRKYAKKTDSLAIIRELEDSCCQDNCLRQLPISYIAGQRKKYWDNNPKQRKEFIRNSISASKVLEADPCPPDSGPSQKKHFLEGVQVCITAWCKVYGIARSSYFESAKAYECGDMSGDTKSGRARSMAFDFAVSWFQKFTMNADSMPTNGVRNLPSCLTKDAVFRIYQEEMRDKDRPCLAKTTFLYNMWKEKFPDVVIPKQSRFTKCTICVHIKEEMSKPHVESQARRKLAIMRKIHLTQQLAERKKYYKHGAKAKAQPEKYLSLTIDGMDQSKHNLPHFTTTTKIDDHAWKLKTHVTGALANYHSKAAAFIDCCQWPHDSNLTINVLLHMLLWIRMTFGKLPPNLYLQMDNCWRENKNRFVLCFLALLVELGIFKKIKISFLMVGHTHEDIDQLFSCISRRLAKINVRTLVELIREIRNSYSPAVETKVIHFMYDVKQWLEGCAVPKLSGHIRQHQFKIVKGPDGQALMFYKKWSTSPDWAPAEGLKLLDKRPSGQPRVIDPDVTKIDFQMLRQALPKFELHFDDETKKWWETFIECKGALLHRRRWMLPLLAPLSAEKDVERTPSTLPQVQEALLKLVEREEMEVEVTTKKKRKAGTKKGPTKQSQPKRVRKW